jgi:nucleotidyltransferase/DNA polymerase involved in DNA repair
VRADFLEKVVLSDIRRIARLAAEDEAALADTLQKTVERDSDATQGILSERLERLLARDRELDTLFERIYEDKTLGKLTEERYLKLSARYEVEQSEIAPKTESLESQLEANMRKDNSIESFLAIIRKNADIRKLTASLLHEFVDEIHVHQAVRRNGRYCQQIDIYYNCVGMVRAPDEKEEHTKIVEMKTRKGVVLTYTPTPASYPAQAVA